MPLVQLTVTADTTAVPGIVPVLVAAAQEWMDAQTPPINYSAMTAQQKVQRYVKGLLMSVYIQRTTGSARATAEGTVAAAQTQATTDANAGLS